MDEPECESLNEVEGDGVRGREIVTDGISVAVGVSINVTEEDVDLDPVSESDKVVSNEGEADGVADPDFSGVGDGEEE